MNDQLRDIYVMKVEIIKDIKLNHCGKESNILSKSTEYRNAFIMCCCNVSDINEYEREIITAFNEKFKNIKESEDGGFGNEIFEGDIKEMMKIFWDICLKRN